MYRLTAEGPGEGMRSINGLWADAVGSKIPMETDDDGSLAFTKKRRRVSEIPANGGVIFHGSEDGG